MIRNCLLYIFTLASFNFYTYVNFNNTITRIIMILAITMMFCYTIRFSYKYNDKISRYVNGLILIIFISMLMSYVFREQDLVSSYRASAVYLTIVFYFYLKKSKPNIESIERFILFFAFLYIILWIYALYRTPLLTFGNAKTALGIDGVYWNERGIVRVNFLGRISLVLGYFLALCKFLYTRRKVYLILSILFILFIILQVTRQLIIWPLLVTICYVYKYLNKNLFYIMLISFVVIICYFLSNNDNVMSKMYLSLVEELYSSEENIRVKEYKYYFTEYSNNILEYIFGNGQPYEKSKFGRFDRSLWQRGLFAEDVGYAKMYILWGLCGLLLYIKLFVYSLSKKMPMNLSYTKMFILFLIPANIAAAWFNSADCIISTAVCLYVISEYSIKSK